MSVTEASDASTSTVTIEIRGAVGVVALNRPDKQNSFNARLRRDLLEAVRMINTAAGIRIAVLAGHGRTFSVGADLDNKRPQGYSIERQINEEYKPILMEIAESPLTWISAVNGAAAGIGSAFAMICDLSVMAQSAYLYQAFAAIGLIPDGGATWHLVRTLGKKRAYEVAISGEKLSAERCLELGLCNRVVSDDQLMPAAIEWAQALALKAPLALRNTKDALARSMELSFGDAVSYEARLQDQCVGSDDFKEGVAAFREKRKPKFLGS